MFVPTETGHITDTAVGPQSDPSNIFAKFLDLTGAPEEAKLVSIVSSGSGCDSEPAVYSVNDESLGLTISTPKLVTPYGWSSPAEVARTFCQIDMTIKYPLGYHYGVKMVNTKGHASLLDGEKPL
jgi:hypothetical protein